jgi:PPP family 3-phenylpropionic acid transporter
MDRSKDRTISLRFGTLQGLYWMIFSPVSSFASVYLLSKNFSNQNIGWVLALNGILAVLLQPSIGSLADRTPRIPLKAYIIAISVMCILMLAALVLLQVNWVWIAVLYVLILALLQTIQPLVNSMVYQYINAGYAVSFGSTRAIGSITFAVLSTILGVWLNSHSPDTLPLIGGFIFVLLLVLVLFIPRVKAPAGIKELPSQEVSTAKPVQGRSFFTKYGKFFIFLFGACTLFVFQTLINSYLVQIMTPLGAKKSAFGLALTIGAVSELPAFFGFTRLTRRMDVGKLIKLAGLFFVVRSLIFLFARSVWAIYVGQVFQGLTFAVIIPAAVAYVDQIMEEGDKVKGQTFATGAMTLGGVISSLAGGWLLDHSTVHATLIFGSITAVIGLLLMIYSVGGKSGAVKTQAEPAE